MSQRTIKGTAKLGETIRSRRQELGLTIEEAATKAGVGTKTWCRYESGASIRADKAKGICKALNWHTLPEEYDSNNQKFTLEEYQQHEAWSQYLCDQYGEIAAIAFAIGSDMILDYINEDLRALSSMPNGSHIGQIPVSMIKDILPEQFLMRYDYDFLYKFKVEVVNLRALAYSGNDIIAHSVLQELAIYLFAGESKFLIETMMEEMESQGIERLKMLDEWVFDLFDDMDIVTCLYSDNYLTEDNVYHFTHWTEDQFYV